METLTPETRELARRTAERVLDGPRGCIGIRAEEAILARAVRAYEAALALADEAYLNRGDDA